MAGPEILAQDKTKLAHAGLFTLGLLHIQSLQPYPGPAHTLLPCVVDLDQVGMQQFGPFSLQRRESIEHAC